MIPFSTIWDWLLEQHSTIAWAVFGLIIISFIVWKVAKFHGECKNCRETCDHNNGIKKDLTRLTEKVNTMLTLLAEKEIIKSNLISTNSPLNLTQEGSNLIEKVGWAKILGNISARNKIFSILDNIKLKTKPDVERYCIVLLHEFNSQRDENIFTPIKKYLYENSSISESDAIFVCALYLRDIYLKERPEIKD